MAASTEEIQALADAVAQWRMQEVRVSLFPRVLIVDCESVHLQFVTIHQVFSKANASTVSFYALYVRLCRSL